MPAQIAQNFCKGKCKAVQCMYYFTQQCCTWQSFNKLLQFSQTNKTTGFCPSFFCVFSVQSNANNQLCKFQNNCETKHFRQYTNGKTLLSKTNFTHKNTSKVEVSKKPTNLSFIFTVTKMQRQNIIANHEIVVNGIVQTICYLQRTCDLPKIALICKLCIHPNCTVFAIAKVNFFLV